MDTRIATTGEARGRPGIAPTWTTSDKDWVSTSLGPSRIWSTVSHGVVNEVYYPRIDIPQIRDLGFIVADDRGFWTEVKRIDHYDLHVTPGQPEVRCVHHHQRYTLTLSIVPDPCHDVLLVKVDLEGDGALRPYALLAPHLGGTGHNNYAAVGEHKGRRMLWAEQGPFGLALAAADAEQGDAWGRASAGYVGISDGWQDFSKNGLLCWGYATAGPGNVALCGELPRKSVLSLGFGQSKEAAATLAVCALLKPYAEAATQQSKDWDDWRACCESHRPTPRDLPDKLHSQFLVSTQVLRTHQDKTFSGAMVASLSVPWGSSHDARGGYHLVWPRDLVESAGALLAVGADSDGRDILRYLIATQNADGHWHQNQWLGGRPYWQGIQLDEAAFPVLLAAALSERNALDGIEVEDMVRRALGFIACNGPASDQDRWEEDAGVNTFTLAACIAALVGGANFLKEPSRSFALMLADFWNAHVEAWTSVENTPLAKQLGVRRYYIREAPASALEEVDAASQILPIKNRVEDPGLAASEQVGVDFLQLVRFGLRRGDDPVITDTIKVVDALLKVVTPSGPSWHRYNGDGYGEHKNGAPFDGAGVGRAWPLLTGERGHYELVVGKDPLPFLETMANMSSRGGLIPEQVLDTDPIPDRQLKPGRPTGSAMPLVWAHAEFIKLAVSRELGRPFDRPDAVWARYEGARPQVHDAVWCEHAAISGIPADSYLWVCLRTPAVVHYSTDDWTTIRDEATEDNGLGLHVVRLPTKDLPPGGCVSFTFRDLESGEWRGKDYAVSVIGGSDRKAIR